MRKSTKNRGKHVIHNMTSLLTLFMAVVMILSVITVPSSVKKAEAAGTPTTSSEATAISNPEIVEDSDMYAGQKVTWDCIYFGSYPQAEVITTEMSRNYAAIEKEYLADGDLLVSDSIYQTLSKATGWDANGDITINGTKYRRIKQSDAIFGASGAVNHYSTYYNWPDSDTYLYFKYEPIKWRVLKTDGDKAFLLADKILDDRPYNSSDTKSNMWEQSTVRSWLNGYDTPTSTYGTASSSFMDTAFTTAEQNAIDTTSLENADNIKSGNEGGNDTTDKVFLLSEAEVYTEAANGYGFVSNKYTFDEAKRSKPSTYAKAMGTEWSTEDIDKGNCVWWLRSPGELTNFAAGVVGHGSVIYCGSVGYKNNGVRPALNMKLSSSNLWRDAGTVCSDGTVKEPVLVTGISFKNNNVSMYVGKTCQLQAAVIPSNATNKGVTYQSSNTKAATVDEKGQVKAVAVGTAVITATASDGGFQAKMVVKVSKQKQTIKVSKTKYTKTYGDKAFTLGAKTTGNGKLTYKSSNTKVVKVGSTGKIAIKGTGKATITIKAAETKEYTAVTKKISITVKPKQMAVKKVTSPKKGTLKVTWSKTSKVSGYEVTIATNSKFTKGKKTYKIKSYKTASKTISKLKSGKTYYVRIRGYKNVKESKTPLYGKYSKVKKIKIK